MMSHDIDKLFDDYKSVLQSQTFSIVLEHFAIQCYHLVDARVLRWLDKFRNQVVDKCPNIV